MRAHGWYAPFALLILTGCLAPIAGERSRPAPTDIFSSAVAPSFTATLEPAALPTPTPTPPTPTATSAPLLSADETFPLPPEPLQAPSTAPEAAIQILAPGPMSSVRSPIRLRGYLVPGYKNRVHVELIGEDGRLLGRHLLYVYTSQRLAYFALEIPFEIKGVSQLARLQVSTEDEAGRTKALSAVRLLLLSSGYEDINPPGDLKERCVLLTPAPGETIHGGVVLVTGYARPLDDLPLILELLGDQGQAIVSRLASLPPAEANGYSPFAVEMPYHVSEPLPVQLVVRQLDGRIGGTMYLYSQEITLAP